MNKKIALFSIMVFSFAFSNYCYSADKPMNLLVLLADDLGVNDLGVNGNKEVHTPNIDKIFKEGIVLDRLYVDSSCRPTRSALMTGLYPASLGFASEGFGISPDKPTLPRILKQNGYRTLHVGKWHLGYIDNEARPNALGYDYYFGFLDQGFLRGPQTAQLVYRRPPTYFDPWLQENNAAPIQYNGHLQDIITQRAVDLIQHAEPGKPWLLNVWFYAPHEPIEPASRYLQGIENPTPKDRYYGLVHQLDDNVGDILAVLEKSKMSQNTIVVFLSDNGGTNGDADNNFPFKGQKTTYLEGGVRVPGVIYWPGNKIGQIIYTPYVRHVDIVPTLLSALGIKSNATFDGIARWDEMSQGKPRKNQAENSFWEQETGFGYQYGVLTADGKWRYTWNLFDPQMPEWLSEVDQIKTANDNVVTDVDNADVIKSMKSSYHIWHDKIRTLNLEKEPAGKTVVKYSGDDFQRTPGTAKFSIALGIKTANLTKDDVVIGRQPDIWAMSVNAEELKFDWMGIHLKGQFSPSQKCQSVVIFTNSMYAGILSDKQSTVAKLYLNGIRVDQKEIKTLQTPLIYPPTYIGQEVNEETKSKASVSVVNTLFRNDWLFDIADSVNPSASAVANSICENH